MCGAGMRGGSRYGGMYVLLCIEVLQETCVYMKRQLVAGAISVMLSSIHEEWVAAGAAVAVLPTVSRLCQGV